jgi:hypothetical protein
MDTHWRTATALGLVNHERNKENKVDTVIREGSKGFRYAFLYGAGVTRAGTQFPLLIGGGLIDRRNPKIKHRAFHRDPPPN